MLLLGTPDSLTNYFSTILSLIKLLTSLFSNLASLIPPFLLKKRVQNSDFWKLRRNCIHLEICVPTKENETYQGITLRVFILSKVDFGGFYQVEAFVVWGKSLILSRIAFILLLFLVLNNNWGF